MPSSDSSEKCLSFNTVNKSQVKLVDSDRSVLVSFGLLIIKDERVFT